MGWIASPTSKTKEGNGTMRMVVEGEGLPLACYPDSAGRPEVKLLEPSLGGNNLTEPEDSDAPSQPERRILVRGYDSDPLRERLAVREIEMICPGRSDQEDEDAGRPEGQAYKRP